MFGLRVILITDNIPIGAEVRTRFIGTTSSRGDFFSNLVIVHYPVLSPLVPSQNQLHNYTL